jgi:hypothetical protein
MYATMAVDTGTRMGRSLADAGAWDTPLTRLHPQGWAGGAELCVAVRACQHRGGEALRTHPPAR